MTHVRVLFIGMGRACVTFYDKRAPLEFKWADPRHKSLFEGEAEWDLGR